MAELSARQENESEALPIISIEISGSGRQPRLLFDRLHLILPAVPLNITSVGTFSVLNDGYDNLDLRYKLPADHKMLPLELEFPEGTLIGIAKSSIPVILRFHASKPTSFTAHIEFLDQDGARLLFTSAIGPIISRTFVQSVQFAISHSSQTIERRLHDRILMQQIEVCREQVCDTSLRMYG
jgi:hypothetical protein